MPLIFENEKTVIVHVSSPAHRWAPKTAYKAKSSWTVPSER